jgi:uncharacterized protein YqeY
MTTLIETIKKDQLQARKNKDSFAATALTTLIGEAEMIGKNDGNRQSTDEEVVGVVGKFVKNINDTIKELNKKGGDNTARVADLEKEKTILNAYMPKQLTEDELRAEMQKLIAEFSLSGPKGMGVLMKELKARFNGAYDGTLASKVAKEVLA